MLTRRRLLIVVPVLVVAAAAAYSLWLALQVRADLNDARASVGEFNTALDHGEVAAQERSVRSLQDAARRAHDHTEGFWWRAITHLPLVGDDATGVRALSTSLATVADDGISPLSRAMSQIHRLPVDGGVDLHRLDSLRGPVNRAHSAFVRADSEVAGLDSSGYAGPVRSRFDDYVRLVGEAKDSLTSAQTALEVLPDILGGHGPRNYLLIFQNNAEIRSTGGMPGSWALLHADGGRLTMTKQGDASVFPHTQKPVLPLSPEEVDVYNTQLGTYWQDAGFTPDFPRAAELWHAHWQRRFPDSQIDGVIALDPVTLSYALEGTGPVSVGDVTLTSANAVRELLSTPYLSLGPAAQNQFFARAARAIFEKSTHQPGSPVKLISALTRSADEGRLLISSFDPHIASKLQGTRVSGALTGDDGKVPHVDVTVDDATGSKMSYYLRYSNQLKARSCFQGRQHLDATMTLHQALSPEQAAALPTSVTGTGQYGTEPGSQLVLVRLYAPYHGTLTDVRLNGKAVKFPPDTLDGRKVFTAVVLMATADEQVLSWSMTTGPGQTGDVELSVTPNVERGSNDAVVPSAC